MFTKKPNSRAASRILFLAAALFALATPAYANEVTLEFYTYGGFEAIVNALNKCALIFSASAYKTLFPTVFAGSLALSMAGAALYKLQTAVKDEGMAVSAPNGFYGALINALIGAALFVGMVLPKGSLQVYDPTSNQTQIVANLPLVLVLAAGTTNLAERAVIDIIETSGDPLAFSKQAGAKAIKVLNQVTMAPINSNDPYLDYSIDAYISDCVMFEIVNTGTADIFGQLKMSTTNLLDTFELAKSPANWTTTYAAGNGIGSSVTCSAAFNDIKARLNTADLSSALVYACKDAGFNTDDINGLNSCKNNVSGFMSAVTTTLTTLTSVQAVDGLIKQLYLSQRLKYVLMQEGDGSLYADNNTFKSQNAALSMFERNAPLIRATTLAATIGFIPFISLFVLTGSWPKAIKFVFAAFMMVAAWDVINALLHTAYVDYAVKWWAQNLSQGIGLDPLDMFSSTAGRLVSYAGGQQLTSFALAMAVFGGSLGMGGAGMAKLSGAGESINQQASNDLKNMSAAEDRGQTISNMRAGMVQDMANAEIGASQLTKQASMKAITSGAGGRMVQDSIGADGMTAAAVGSEIRAAGDGAAAIKQGIPQTLENKQFDAESRHNQTGMRKDSVGGDAQKDAAHAMANELGTRNAFGNDPKARQSFVEAQQGKSIGQQEGEMREFNAAQKAGFSGSWGDFWAMQSETQTAKAYHGSQQFADIAAKHGMSADQMAKVQAAAAEARTAASAVTVAGGASAGFSKEQTQAIRGDLGDKALTDKQYDALAQKHHIAGKDGMSAGQTLKASHDGLLAGRAAAGTDAAKQAQAEQNWAASVQQGAWMKRDVAGQASDTAGMVAEQGTVKEIAQAEQERAANTAQLLQQHPELASNRDYVNENGSLTLAGTELMEKGRAGGKVADFVDKNGTKHAAMLDDKGKIVQTSAAGVINKGDTDRLNQLKSDLKSAGFGEAAKRLDQLKDHGFGFRVTRGSDGQIATFEIGSGGNAKYTDRWDKNTGSTVRYTNNTERNTTDRVEAGKRYSTGDQVSTKNTFESGTQRINYDEDLQKIGHGFEFTGDTLRQMLTGADGKVHKGMVAPMFGANPQAGIDAVSVNYSQAMGAYLKQEGINQSTAEMGASLSAGFKAMGLGAGFSLSAKEMTAAKSSVDLANIAYNKAATGLKAVADSHKDWTDSRKQSYVAAGLQQFSTETVKAAKLKAEQGHGPKGWGDPNSGKFDRSNISDEPLPDSRYL